MITFFRIQITTIAAKGGVLNDGKNGKILPFANTPNY